MDLKNKVVVITGSSSGISATTALAFAGKNEEGGWGNTFMAFNPNLLLDLSQFKTKVHTFVETVRNSRSKDDKKVRIPGENTMNTRDQNLKSGSVEAPDELIAALNNYLKTGEL